jgi:iron-sulfur cluster assembly protein
VHAAVSPISSALSPAEGKPVVAEPSVAQSAGGPAVVEDTNVPSTEAKKPPVLVTPKAVQKAKERFAKRGTPEAALRLGVRGGGCSGFNYVVEVHDGPARARDTELDFDGLRVVVDKKSLVYLAGSVLDWEQTLMQQGFKYLNPQEASSCGCGHSFTVK